MLFGADNVLATHLALKSHNNLVNLQAPRIHRRLHQNFECVFAFRQGSFIKGASSLKHVPILSKIGFAGRRKRVYLWKTTKKGPVKKRLPVSVQCSFILQCRIHYFTLYNCVYSCVLVASFFLLFIHSSFLKLSSHSCTACNTVMINLKYFSEFFHKTTTPEVTLTTRSPQAK